MKSIKQLFLFAFVLVPTISFANEFPTGSFSCSHVEYKWGFNVAISDFKAGSLILPAYSIKTVGPGPVSQMGIGKVVTRLNSNYLVLKLDGKEIYIRFDSPDKLNNCN